MICNYFKIAWRNIWKNKLFSFVNIMGLGLAIPFALLSLMQVQSVFEYDNFHPEREKIYRVTTQIETPSGEKTKYGSSPMAVASRLREDYPFVEKATHTTREFGWELNNSIKTIEVNPLFVEPDFFKIFAFPLRTGTIPDSPNTIVLSHEMAQIFFGDANPIGKTVTHHDYGELTITGVLQPYEKTTHFRSDVLVSMATQSKFRDQNPQLDLTGYTYVKLQNEENRKNLDAALAAITANTNKLVQEKDEKRLFQSQAFDKISPDFEELEDNPYVESLRDLSVNFFMALAIILLVSFNYTNLTLARSLNRANEVGIRKVNGASRNQLVWQFLCESILIALFALVVGFFLLKIMEEFITVNWLTWEVDNYLILWSVFISFTVLTSAVAGIIPAKILSRFSPAKVLKGNLNPASFGKIGFRKSLVVIQFVVTACFIFLIANMFSQFRYMATDNENFNRKDIYNISVRGDHTLMANEIASHKNVESVGFTSAPFGGTSMTAAIKEKKLDENFEASYYAVDADFIKNMKLEIIAGENLHETSGDSTSNFIVVNEKTLFPWD
ncbi:ABC transporter permease [Antarcticibacterium sp. 1MA-6-2]|uniref:ABC transporter permease n=1 Tax=Antarcticibacterium sp. 1MA-6-2 TaxID=2908210 RepID=UPI001F20559A|nr:ABC transporter permease [Antarcticibacterium sp. 1MA-6-2]UJH90999.1 ABC transporter permease [Antarcticibacterium sp. 1MA-6-2]